MQSVTLAPHVAAQTAAGLDAVAPQSSAERTRASRSTVKAPLEPTNDRRARKLLGADSGATAAGDEGRIGRGQRRKTAAAETVAQSKGAGDFDVEAAIETIRRDGIVGLPNTFDRRWAEELRQDYEILFKEARSYEKGTVSRGRNRFYFAIHPERLRGFLELVTNPKITALCEKMLGPDYKIAEIAFDVPLPGAVVQPWHRDFPMPEETKATGRLTSIAFNATTVDVKPEMGPFEIAPGTQWDDGTKFKHGMFPEKELYPRYEERAQKKMPKQGDISARTALAIHRGTPNESDTPRAVLVLGVWAADVQGEERDLVFTRKFYDALPEEVKKHLACDVVDELEPIIQRHSIEGLMMGGEKHEPGEKLGR
jgi:ectoine hydroxylase-related dioxygenase (phytanoyl-CoA dioxygenase family)